jgi:hypothetical protein
MSMRQFGAFDGCVANISAAESAVERRTMVAESYLISVLISADLNLAFSCLTSSPDELECLVVLDLQAHIASLLGSLDGVKSHSA